MAKAPAPKIGNPAGSPKRTMTAQEAEKALTMPEPEVTNDSEETEPEAEQTDQDIIDEVFGTDGENGDDETDDEEEPDEEEIEDKPTKPATVVPPKAAKGKAGSNLSPEQQKYWDEIGKLGIDQGKGISSLIFLAEKAVTIGAHGVFETSQLKDLYMHFRKNSNTAAGKNAEVGAEDHTVVSQTSKLRTFYKVGEKFGVDGWSKMLKVARDIHVSILRDKDARKYLRSKQLVPTYEALVKVASTQIKKEADAKGVKHDVYPQLLTEDQIRDVYVDPNKKETEPSVKDVIDAAAKAVERVIRGKVNPSTGEQTREAFEFTGDPNTDDNSVAYALTSTLSWILQSGERYQKGYIANREKEMAEAKAAADERHRKHEERMAKENAEREAKAKKRAEEKAKKEAEAKLAKEQAVAAK